MTRARPGAAGAQGAFDVVRRADVVVVGTGAAGLSAVTALSGYRVSVLSKGEIGRDGSSRYAQGGIAVALRPEDSPRAHARDTQRVGAGLSHAANTRILTEEGPERVLDLLAAGAGFDRAADGALTYGLEAGHRVARILHADDATGAELMRTLVRRTATQENLDLDPGVFAYDLALQAGRVIGVLALAANGDRVLYLAPAVVLATGGIGQLYPYTTNPIGATGDGIAMAARAGALLSDLEFVQFHPTALAVDANPRPLLTEALRGAGATIVDDHGHRLMADIHPDAELAPRDIVARSVWEHVHAGRAVYLDARAIFRDGGGRFSTVAGLAAEHGIDPQRDLLPIVPAAHYAMGGVWIDDRGRTSLPGLWAGGESACTGVHGANRLASNSLLEALVFGWRAGLDIRRHLDAGASAPSALVAVAPQGVCTIDPRPVAESQGVSELRDKAFSGLGIVREAATLEQTRSAFASELTDLMHERSERTSLLTVGLAIAEAALARRESRGAHARSDYLETRSEEDHHSGQRLSWQPGAVIVRTQTLDAARGHPPARRADSAGSRER